MTERIKKYKRYKDFWTFSSMEVKLALISTIIVSAILLLSFDFFQSFFEFKDSLQQFIITIIGGEFTLLGMSLAGMAIITSLFSQEMLNVINKVNDENIISRILSHFEFSAFNLSIQMSYFVILFFAISSNKKVVNENLFTFILVVVIYHFFFNLFYIIALIGNCIEIYNVKNYCNKISVIEKSQTDVANEVRIDYILAILLKDKGINRTQLLKDLYGIIDKSNINDRQQIKDYLKKYYSGE